MESVAASHRASLYFSTGLVELRYIGRDTGRWYWEFLSELAEVIGDAEGEIVCEIPDDEKDDPDFEFFSIAGGKLYIENGMIVRSNKRPVAADISK